MSLFASGLVLVPLDWLIVVVSKAKSWKSIQRYKISGQLDINKNTHVFIWCKYHIEYCNIVSLRRQILEGQLLYFRATWNFVPDLNEKSLIISRNIIYILGNIVFWNATQSVARFMLWKISIFKFLVLLHFKNLILSLP